MNNTSWLTDLVQAPNCVAWNKFFDNSNLTFRDEQDDQLTWLIYKEIKGFRKQGKQLFESCKLTSLCIFLFFVIKIRSIKDNVWHVIRRIVIFVVNYSFIHPLEYLNSNSENKSFLYTHRLQSHSLNNSSILLTDLFYNQETT